MKDFLTAYTSAWTRSFDYKGRTDLPTFLKYTLVNAVVFLVANLAAMLGSFFYALAVLYIVAMLVPTLAITVRRVRDARQ